MKLKAISEVIIVLSLVLLSMAVIGLSPLGQWQRQVSTHPFIEYSVMILLPILLLMALRRDLAHYGLSLRNLPYHLDITATAIIPISLANIPFAFMSGMQWQGSLLLAGVRVVVLVILGLLFKHKPTRDEKGVIVGALTLLAISTHINQGPASGNAFSAILFYVFFLGLGEELLFRGYIQSRLNIAFGKPYQFFGIRWGWGLIITSSLFGLMHVINLGSLVSGIWALSWWWGFWTFFSGLVYGLVREKSGGIVAPTLLHGLPQAIAYAILAL